MHFGVLLTVLVTVALAELPDKTMIATLIMGTKVRPLFVWIGASLGFIVQMAIAVLAGRLLLLLPHRIVEGVVTLLFLGGAAYLLFVPEEAEEEKGAEEAAAEKPGSALRVIFGAFSVIFLAEFGDLSQILVANFTAKSHLPLETFLGASIGLVSVAALGAFSGTALLRVLPLSLIRRAGGVLLLGLGIYSLVNLL
jgi:putative Ca2+/H+ antiporter (TMEM165/GDT1 family)